MDAKDKHEPDLPLRLLKRNFPHEPTQGQMEFFRRMNDYLTVEASGDRIFLLKGYAGTGKTSLVSALVKTLPKLKLKSLLLAPTGRAAKVMGNYSLRSAFTIHKIIYKPKGELGDGGAGFVLQKNYSKNTVFIVDEASMISDESFGGRSLLRDLIRFVFQEPSNSLLMVGDMAQLPPVGSSLSPGLDGGYLKRHFGLSVTETELREVMRQQLDSGILFNATKLRNEIYQAKPAIRMQTLGFKDFYKMTGERLEDGLRYAYEKFGIEQAIVITRSNKAAVQYNQYIRRSIHFHDDELAAGDFLMVVKNNYLYMAESERVSFIANGDFVEIMKLRSLEEMYGFRFATLELRMVDYPDEPYFEAKVLLDTLYSDGPSLTSEQFRSLYQQVSADYADVADKNERMELIKKDSYLSALQVKFAYALTCHKAQGGQWEAVFVDQGYLTEEQVNSDFLRWLYTAMTRARKELFMVNFHPKFYINNNETENQT